MKSSCTFVVFCVAAFYLSSQACGEECPESHAQARERLYECLKENPDHMERPGCLIKCVLERGEKLTENGRPKIEEMKNLVHICKPDGKRKRDLLKCLDEKGPLVDPNQPDCKGYLIMMECVET